MSALALLGPFAAIGLYEIAPQARTRHEHIMAPCLRRAPFAGHAGDHRDRQLCLFALSSWTWLFAAKAIYEWQFGSNVPLDVHVPVGDARHQPG